MKRLILSAACTLSLASCGGPPTGPNQKLGNESSQTVFTTDYYSIFYR